MSVSKRFLQELEELPETYRYRIIFKCERCIGISVYIRTLNKEYILLIENHLPSLWLMHTPV